MADECGGELAHPADTHRNEWKREAVQRRERRETRMLGREKPESVVVHGRSASVSASYVCRSTWVSYQQTADRRWKTTYIDGARRRTYFLELGGWHLSALRHLLGVYIRATWLGECGMADREGKRRRPWVLVSKFRTAWLFPRMPATWLYLSPNHLFPTLASLLSYHPPGRAFRYTTVCFYKLQKRTGTNQPARHARLSSWLEHRPRYV